MYIIQKHETEISMISKQIIIIIKKENRNIIQKLVTKTDDIKNTRSYIQTSSMIQNSLGKTSLLKNV